MLTPEIARRMMAIQADNFGKRFSGPSSSEEEEEEPGSEGE